MKLIGNFALIIAAMFYATISVSAPLMQEDFEVGNLSTSNGIGFTWKDSNNTSVIVNEPRLGKTSKYGLRFNYAAGASISEQRYDLGKAYRNLWIRFWLKVPENFQHNTKNPSNNKLGTVWMDGYSAKGDGPTVIWEYWSDGSGGSKLAVHYSAGKYTVAGVHLQYKPFISYPSDQGRWMQIAFHVKAATARGSNDGVIETYRRWQDESSFTKLHTITDADIASPPAGPNGWKAGYFLGWSNPSFTQNTTFIIDDVEFSETELLGISARPLPPSERN